MLIGIFLGSYVSGGLVSSHVNLWDNATQGFTAKANFWG
jgi:hypothetical protein